MRNILFSVFPNENFVDLGLYQYGRERCTPAHSFGPASRNHYLFHYVLSGKGQLTTDDKAGRTHTYHVKSGQGFMLFPQQITTYIADAASPWEYVWVEFDGLRVKEAVELAGLTSASPIYRSGNASLSEQMADEMRYLSNHASESPLQLIGHLYLFLDYLTRSSASMRLTQGGRIRDFYMKEALSYIEQHFHQDISVEELASLCGLNRSYFGKIFRDSTGKSPQEFILSYRMAKAAELLRLSQLSVKEIGASVGYVNQLHFSRAFKSVYGLSPRNFRVEQHLLF